MHFDPVPATPVFGLGAAEIVLVVMLFPIVVGLMIGIRRDVTLMAAALGGFALLFAA